MLVCKYESSENPSVWNVLDRCGDFGGLYVLPHWQTSYGYLKTSEQHLECDCMHKLLPLE